MTNLSAARTFKQYMSISTAFNVDKYQFQSMVSTVHKLLRLEKILQEDKNWGEAVNLASTISECWYNLVCTSPLFKQHANSFEYIDRISSLYGDIRFNHDQFIDETVKYILIESPNGVGPELMNIEDGEKVIAQKVYRDNASMRQTSATIDWVYQYVYSFINCSFIEGENYYFQ